MGSFQRGFSEDEAVEVGRGEEDSGMPRGETEPGRGEKAGISKPRREASEETNPARTLVLHYRPPELEKIVSVVEAPPPVAHGNGRPRK